MTVASVTTTTTVSQVVVSTELSIVGAQHACLRRVIRLLLCVCTLAAVTTGTDTLSLVCPVHVKAAGQTHNTGRL